MNDAHTTPEVRAALEQLVFHDSMFRSIELSFGDRRARSCRVLIDYYDWEGNEARRKQDASARWQWRSLELSFAYLACFEYSAPDLLNRAQDIDRIALDRGLAELRAAEQRAREFYSQYRSPLFDVEGGALSIEFVTQNYGADREGFVRIVGSGCTLRWDTGPAPVGGIHIPLAPGSGME